MVHQNGFTQGLNASLDVVIHKESESVFPLQPYVTIKVLLCTYNILPPDGDCMAGRLCLCLNAAYCD